MIKTAPFSFSPFSPHLPGFKASGATHPTGKNSPKQKLNKNFT